ncbi:MAG TPA: hypothetical protein VKB51_13595 [bacterium]|nr:hypothetical protein [bacterium]
MAEQVSAKLRAEVLERARGRCECMMSTCGDHQGRCHRPLEGDWAVHRLRAGGPYALSNVLGMCPACHRKAPELGSARR